MCWLKNFLDTWDERHAMIIGFFEVICPWPAAVKPTGRKLSYLKKEYHYYVGGRALGAVALGALIILAVKILS